MKHICVIPARLGSKRLPRKNLRKFGDRPLVQHTIDSALESQVFSKVVLTSESEEVLEVARGEIVKDLRPPELATDTSKVIDTVKYCFTKYCEDDEAIWLALPTCPLRESIHFQDVQYLLDQYPAVVSVTNYEFPVTLALKMNKNGVVSSLSKKAPWEHGDSRSQDHKTYYRPNGAIYASTYKHFVKYTSFYTPKTYGYFMPKEKSIDIDTITDFEYAQFLLEKLS